MQRQSLVFCLPSGRFVQEDKPSTATHSVLFELNARERIFKKPNGHQQHILCFDFFAVRFIKSDGKSKVFILDSLAQADILIKLEVKEFQLPPIIPPRKRGETVRKVDEDLIYNHRIDHSSSYYLQITRGRAVW
ncbi:MAG: hypothetical protein AYP45_17185 [Candidatus Brocadia carolinensis]|uniref:Uncharacterized protein n=1 Tax=Candidatus Brocadia carolinensis TaxID=1004156 RepID=A0A1V4APC2_9BACT|nr:MAG: hypothetical protein AYP45_17185 [Candidatus Brocadia caroliniensis]